MQCNITICYQVQIQLSLSPSFLTSLLKRPVKEQEHTTAHEDHFPTKTLLALLFRMSGSAASARNSMISYDVVASEEIVQIYIKWPTEDAGMDFSSKTRI